MVGSLSGVTSQTAAKNIAPPCRNGFELLHLHHLLLSLIWFKRSELCAYTHICKYGFSRTNMLWCCAFDNAPAMAFVENLIQYGLNARNTVKSIRAKNCL